tara:strand:+ start:893 stop:1144 length:252 start_codon:yes stop_codon:yes gene_type:complete
MNRTYETMSKKELVTLVKRLTKQHDEWSAEATQLRELPRVTIDEWDKVLGSEHTGPYVTLYIEGKEYIGALRLYKDEEGKVIE